jgi:hypothetical protein
MYNGEIVAVRFGAWFSDWWEGVLLWGKTENWTEKLDVLSCGCSHTCFTGVHSMVHYIIVKKYSLCFPLTAAVGPLSNMPYQWPFFLSSKTVNVHNIDVGGIPEFRFCPQVWKPCICLMLLSVEMCTLDKRIIPSLPWLCETTTGVVSCSRTQLWPRSFITCGSTRANWLRNLGTGTCKGSNWDQVAP